MLVAILTLSYVFRKFNKICFKVRGLVLSRKIRNLKSHPQVYLLNLVRHTYLFDSGISLARDVPLRYLPHLRGDLQYSSGSDAAKSLSRSDSVVEFISPISKLC